MSGNTRRATRDTRTKVRGYRQMMTQGALNMAVPSVSERPAAAAARPQSRWSLPPGLLTIDRRRDGFDEPGALLAGGLLLKWSWLDPSPFLARLVTAMLGTSAGIYRRWRADLELPLAVAWRRCRAAGATG